MRGVRGNSPGGDAECGVRRVVPKTRRRGMTRVRRVKPDRGRVGRAVRGRATWRWSVLETNVKSGKNQGGRWRRGKPRHRVPPRHGVALETRGEAGPTSNTPRIPPRRKARTGLWTSSERRIQPVGIPGRSKDDRIAIRTERMATNLLVVQYATNCVAT